MVLFNFKLLKVVSLNNNHSSSSNPPGAATILNPIINTLDSRRCQELEVLEVTMITITDQVDPSLVSILQVMDPVLEDLRVILQVVEGQVTLV